MKNYKYRTIYIIWKLIKNCDIEDSKKENGILERIVSECIMITYHFDKWNKNGKRLATYLNENGTEEQFNKLDENISRLENIVMEKSISRMTPAVR